MRIAILQPTIAENAADDDKDTLVQVEFIQQVYAEMGHEVTCVMMATDIALVQKQLEKFRPHLVVNLLETILGSGHLLHLGPSLLDVWQIPYTGNSTNALFITSDKVLSKEWMVKYGIPTPAWIDLNKAATQTFQSGQRYIVKSAWEHASIGLDDSAIVSPASKDELLQLIHSRKSKLGGKAFAEDFIKGREFNLSVLEVDGKPKVFKPAEIDFSTFPPQKDRIVGYAAKWTEDSFEYNNTPRTFSYPPEDQALLSQMSELARQCWEVFDLNGYVRVDFRVSETGQPYVLEINANPCITPYSGFMAAAEESQFTPAQVFQCILESASKKH